MKKYIICALSGLLMTSCVDTNVLPDDMIVESDFWQTRQDVSMMVSGAYYAMASSDVMQRLIVWGAARSDEFNPHSLTLSNNATYTQLQEMNTGNMDDENVYANWASLYTVINRCNQVIDRAAVVMERDPSYTEATYNTDRSQMLALRALCYFYLVRAFRDVPYTDQAYFNTSQEMSLTQTAPGIVLQHCIDDLNEALESPLSPTGYDDWRRVGLINRDGIRAILADIYLWRASMTGNQADYQQCVDLCQQIINSKLAVAESSQQGGPMGFGGVSILQYGGDRYPLYNGNEAFSRIFSQEGNSDESIFELQMSGGTAAYNSGLCTMYLNYNLGSSTSHGFLEPSANVFETNASSGTVSARSVDQTRAFATANDYRFGGSTLGIAADGATPSSTVKLVRKMIDQNQASSAAASDRVSGGTAYGRMSGNNYSQFIQNWIVYRLTDIMLMQAEAMVQLASGDEDYARLGSAFNIVQTVNARSLDEANLSGDSLRYADFTTKAQMEELVLAERLRELCYEGKRWFDLMRYNYRNGTGTTDIELTMNEILGEANVNTYPVQSYDGFTRLVLRKYLQAGTVQSKLMQEPYLYFPVYYTEMNANTSLVQNPAYAGLGDFERN